MLQETELIAEELAKARLTEGYIQGPRGGTTIRRNHMTTAPYATERVQAPGLLHAPPSREGEEKIYS